jgi:hypothetical protein
MSNPTAAYEVVITILYKRTPDFTFDMDYFLQKHIPSCEKAWASHGLLGATVTEAAADSAYTVINSIRFKTMEGWQNATSDTEQIGLLMADIANFTNQTPEFVVGTVVKGGMFGTS